MSISISIEHYRSLVEERDDAREHLQAAVLELKEVKRSRSAYKGVNTRLKRQVEHLKDELDLIAIQNCWPQDVIDEPEPVPVVPVPVPVVPVPEPVVPVPEPIAVVDPQPEYVQAVDCDCVICMESISTESGKKLPCGHIYHTACIDTWAAQSNTCPTCRHPLSVDPVEPGRSHVRVVLFDRDVDPDTGLLGSLGVDTYNIVSDRGGDHILIEEYGDPSSILRYDVLEEGVYLSPNQMTILYEYGTVSEEIRDIWAAGHSLFDTYHVDS